MSVEVSLPKINQPILSSSVLVIRHVRDTYHFFGWDNASVTFCVCDAQSRRSGANSLASGARDSDDENTRSPPDS
jgi:hypothetical protein